MGHLKKPSLGIVVFIFVCLLFAFVSYMQPAQTETVHAQIVYTVIFSTSGGGPQSTITPSGTQTGPPSQINVSASAGPGYSFSHWTAIGSITFANTTSPTTTASINSSGNITAVFTQNTYSVTFATSGGGSSTTSPTGTQSYTLNQVVPISVTTALGYTFSTWSATGGTTFDSATTASTNAHIGGAGTITATFTQNVYSVGVTVLPSSAAGSVSGYVTTQTYHYGDVVTLTESPSNGYTFSSWGGDGSGSATTCQITVTKNMAVTATFTQNQYTLTVSVVGTGCSVTQVPNQATYTYGSSVQLTPVAAAGWTFSGWSGALSGSANPGSVTITGNTAVTATFTQITYQVSFASIGGGSGSSTSPAGSPTYNAGSVVPISAIPASGYSFSSWSTIGSITIANPTSASTTATINGAGTITAVFTQNSYSLSINTVGSGSVSKNQTTYHYGDGVQLTATPSNGYVFSGWTGDLTGLANPTTITITGNMAVTTTFTQSAYSVSVTVLPSGAGSVTVNHSAPYHYGDVVGLTETASNGWSFVSWSGDGTGTGTTRSITVTGNMAVTATFAQVIYSVTFATSGSGTTNPSGTQTYTAGQIVQVNAVANNGYTFTSWTASGAITFDDANSASTSVTINGAGTITSTFQANPTASPTQAPTQTASPTTHSPTTVPTQSPTQTSSTPNLTTKTILATSDDGHNSYITVSGVSDGSDISAATLTSDQSAAKTTLSLTLTGQSQINSFCNITIPKGAILYGTKPTIYVNNQAATNQGYTQDENNYYVWFTTVLETYQLSIVFASQPSSQIWVAIAIVILAIVLVIAIILPKIRNKT